MFDPSFFLKKAEGILDYSFKNKKLLLESLTHPSILGDKKQRLSQSYERLEFLGDSVLSFILADTIFRNFPSEQEGFLSRRLTSLVRGSIISGIARDLGISDVILVSNSKKTEIDVINNNALEDVLEAIIGAMYLDGGIGVAKKFIMKHWLDCINEKKCPAKDNKTLLQEVLQKNGMQIPVYSIVDKSGSDHAPFFTVRVEVENGAFSIGSGKSKKIAEMNAANFMLRVLDKSI